MITDGSGWAAGRRAFQAKCSARSVTTHSQADSTVFNGRSITVIDTPGASLPQPPVEICTSSSCLCCLLVPPCSLVNNASNAFIQTVAVSERCLVESNCASALA